MNLQLKTSMVFIFAFVSKQGLIQSRLALNRYIAEVNLAILIFLPLPRPHSLPTIIGFQACAIVLTTMTSILMPLMALMAQLPVTPDVTTAAGTT